MKKYILFISFLISFQALIFSSTYYVSPTGDNNNDGSYEHPWATPGYGSKHLQPGDTLIIMAGEYILSTYWDDMITPAPGGTDGNYITIKGESADNRPVLKGRNNLFSAIDLGDCSYVKIENLEITNYNGENFREGISAWNPASHIILKNLYIHHLDEMGIDLKDIDHLEIENCRVSYCGFGAVGGPAGEHGGWKNIHIKDSTFSYSGHYYQGGSGPSPYDRPDGFGIEPSDGPILVENCKFSHNLGDGFDCKAHNTTIHDSIISNNTCDGLKLWGNNSIAYNCLIYGRGDGDFTPTPWGSIVVDTPNNATIKLINLTIHQHDSLTGYPLYFQYGSNASLNLIMTNCIVMASNSPVYFGDSVNLTATSNIFYIKNSQYQIEYHGTGYTSSEISNFGTGNISEDPEFVNPSPQVRNFHLKPTSPAIDSGTVTSDTPDLDLDGNTRPQGNTIDIGCYEFKNTPGDLSMDGNVNSLDITILANYLAGNLTPGTPPFNSDISAADLNGDNQVDTADFVLLAKHLTEND